MPVEVTRHWHRPPRAPYHWQFDGSASPSAASSVAAAGLVGRAATGVAPSQSPLAQSLPVEARVARLAEPLPGAALRGQETRCASCTPRRRRRRTAPTASTASRAYRSPCAPCTSGPARTRVGRRTSRRARSVPASIVTAARRAPGRGLDPHLGEDRRAGAGLAQVERDALVGRGRGDLRLHPLPLRRAERRRVLDRAVAVEVDARGSCPPRDRCRRRS